jgi:hypothetical protein
MTARDPDDTELVAQRCLDRHAERAVRGHRRLHAGGPCGHEVMGYTKVAGRRRSPACIRSFCRSCSSPCSARRAIWSSARTPPAAIAGDGLIVLAPTGSTTYVELAS